jgi:hypothetical protein
MMASPQQFANSNIKQPTTVTSEAVFAKLNSFGSGPFTPEVAKQRDALIAYIKKENLAQAAATQANSTPINNPTLQGNSNLNSNSADSTNQSQQNLNQVCDKILMLNDL